MSKSIRLASYFSTVVLLVSGCENSTDDLSGDAGLDGSVFSADGASAADARGADAGVADAAPADAAPGDALPSDGAVPVASQDPAPGLTAPGRFTIPADCPGCPTSADTVFDLAVDGQTSHLFSGTVTGAVGDGVFFVQDSSTVGGERREIWGPIPTAANGLYSFTAPLFCGEQIIKCVWSNAAGKYVLLVRVVTTNCVEPDLRITMTWDNLGNDWELHLIKPGGFINDTSTRTDCTWNTCVGSSPDWGVLNDASDNPKKDVDNTGHYGPENIFLSKPETGRFTVLVEHWSSGGDPMSDGRVIINVLGKVYAFEVTDLAPYRVWNVATIDWPSGAVTPGGSVFDCSATWASGCKAVLP